jgi:hypothetical protein
MGFIVADRTNRLKVQVKEKTLNNDQVPLGYFLDELEAFTADLADDVEVLVGGGACVYLEAVRDETDEEYDARIAEIKSHHFKMQKEKDSSWERQKRKFARARGKYKKNG